MTTLAALNALDQPAFTALVGPVFEHSPWIAEATWAQRPFASRAALHRALVQTMRAADEAAQVALIRAHPDLVGRAARAGTLTPASTQEQAGAGLGALAPDESARFDRYNAAYHARFGFPFVICARENKKDAILTAFPVRLTHSRADEIDTALGEIAKIAGYRLADLLADP